MAGECVTQEIYFNHKLKATPAEVSDLVFAHRNTPQHTAAHCNTPQHTATHQLKATTPEKKFKRGICRRVLHIRRHLTTQMKTPNYTYEHTYIFIRTVVKKYVSFAHRLAACTHILNKESEPI